MTTAELIQELDRLKAIMISVATGGPRIQEVQPEFAREFDAVNLELSGRGIENTLPYRDLWQWYGHWSGDEQLKTYRSRRKFVADHFEPLIKTVRNQVPQTGLNRTINPIQEDGTNLMAPKLTQPPQRPHLNPQQMKLAIDRIRKRIGEVEALDPSTLEKWSPLVDALQAAIDDSLTRAFGYSTVEYGRYRRNVNWAAEIPSFGEETSLEQFRKDVTKGKQEVLVMLRQAVVSLEEELGEQNEFSAISADMNSGSHNIFIGHGRSPLWRELKDFLKDRIGLTAEEFNSVSVAGIPTVARLTEMLNGASFAFLIMTAEDQQPDGKARARENVVHEAGLFQGRLGFARAIILLEEGCEEFSNIHGLGQIRFPKGNIAAKFEEIRLVLEREGISIPGAKVGR